MNDALEAVFRNNKHTHMVLFFILLMMEINWSRWSGGDMRCQLLTLLRLSPLLSRVFTFLPEGLYLGFWICACKLILIQKDEKCPHLRCFKIHSLFRSHCSYIHMMIVRYFFVLWNWLTYIYYDYKTMWYDTSLPT